MINHVAAGVLMIAGLLAVSYSALAQQTSEKAPDAAHGMPLVFEDDFESGHTRWSMTDPKAWSIVDDDGRRVLALHGKSQYAPPFRSPANIALIKDLDLTDFVLEATVKYTGRDYGHSDLCIFFGHTGPATFYYVHLAAEPDDHAHAVFLVNQSARKSIVQERNDGAPWDDQYHTIRVTRDTASGRIEVYFDDMTTPIMRTVDTTFTTGTLGLGSFDDTGQFDNIRIWGLKAGE